MSAVMWLARGNRLVKATPLSTGTMRALSSVPAERKADFAPRVISQGTFPDLEVKKLRRGTGGRSSFNGMIVTVFGATGFLARAVVNGLGKIGTQVICPYRGDPYFTKELKLAGDLGQILFVPYSIRDLDSVYRAIQHSSVVINLIGRNNPTKNFDFESIHVEWPRTLGRICRETGIKRLLHMSALNSSPDPPAYYMKGGSNFLKSKYYGELAIKEEYPDVTILRPADMYGDCDNYLWYLCRLHRRKNRRFPLPNGGYDIYKTPVAASDVAAGVVNAITDEDAIGQTYDCVGPRRYEYRYLMEYLQEVINKTRDGEFKINNLDFDLGMKVRIAVYTWWCKAFSRNPGITWEMVERESISDEVPQNPTLPDLGVKLALLEDKWPDILSLWRFENSYEGVLGERKNFTNPPYILDNGQPSFKVGPAYYQKHAAYTD